MTIEEWESVMAVNITTPLFLIQKFLPFLNRGSNIIFTGSSMAIFPHSVFTFLWHYPNQQFMQWLRILLSS